MNVTIIGAGEMAEAIARTLHSSGLPMRILARRREAAASLADTLGAFGGTVEGGTVDAPLGDDIVVLAVPSEAVLDLATRRGREFDGHVVVDASIPPADSATSVTEALQSLRPAARVVKAFGTVFAPALLADDPGEGSPVVLVATDDTGAGADVIDLLHRCDVAAVSVGSLAHARELDAVARLQASLAADGTISRTGGFSLRY